MGHDPQRTRTLAVTSFKKACTILMTRWLSAGRRLNSETAGAPRRCTYTSSTTAAGALDEAEAEAAVEAAVVEGGNLLSISRTYHDRHGRV